MQAIGNIAHNLTHIIEKRSEMTNKMYVGIDKIKKKINGRRVSKHTIYLITKEVVATLFKNKS